jgi:hypothetical protein
MKANWYDHLFPVFLKILLLSVSCKVFQWHEALALPARNRTVMVHQGESRRHVHIPTSGMAGHPRARLYQPHDDPFYGPTLVFSPQIKPPNQMEQVVCEKAHFQSGFICSEPVTARWMMVFDEVRTAHPDGHKMNVELRVCAVHYASIPMEGWGGDHSKGPFCFPEPPFPGA